MQTNLASAWQTLDFDRMLPLRQCAEWSSHMTIERMMDADSVSRRQHGPRLVWAALYAIAMGILEAICVVYLRRLIDPGWGDLRNAVEVIGGSAIEPIREACTLVMLLAVAWLAGTTCRSRVAYFFYLFGIWDILYYVGLYAFAGWPASLLDWDCLFLIPRPWFGPVLAPVLISACFIFASTLVILREASGLRFSWPFLALQGAGFALWYLSFVKDSDRILAQGYSGVHYSWLLLATGMILCVGSLLYVRLAARLPDAA